MLSLSLLALILTKLADIITTVQGIRRAGGSVAGERNPFARWAFQRWGLGWGIAFVMLLWCGVVALCYVPAFLAPAWYQIVTALGGFAISWCQWEVARMNATGRHSLLTAWLLNAYQHFSASVTKPERSKSPSLLRSKRRS